MAEIFTNNWVLHDQMKRDKQYSLEETSEYEVRK